MSTWTDGKFGMPGGGVKKGENVITALNREFSEEIGSDVTFTEEDFCFAQVHQTATYVFCRVTADLDFFENILRSFHNMERKAYVDEIMGVLAYPVWIEGPANVQDVCWQNNVWGLPRHLCAQGGMYVLYLCFFSYLRLPIYNYGDTCWSGLLQPLVILMHPGNISL